MAIRHLTGQWTSRPIPRQLAGLGAVRRQPHFPQIAGLGAVRRQPHFPQIAGLGAASLAPLTTDPNGPPADATVLSTNPPMFFDMTSGNLWYNTTKLAIIPGVITAVAIKVIMFGGGKVATAAKNKFLGSK
jgi:hypothetical protein